MPENFVFRIHSSRLSEMENRPEQHRSVTVRQDKPISIGPYWILGIEPENAVPQRIHEWSEGHGRTRVSGFCLLDRVNRQRADGIDGKLVELFVWVHGVS